MSWIDLANDEKRRHVVVVVKGQPLPHKHIAVGEIKRSFGKSFGDILKSMFGCDCSRAKCQDEVTRQECEQHQGLFVDKLSVKNRCQCCDKCYVLIGLLSRKMKWSWSLSFHLSRSSPEMWRTQVEECSVRVRLRPILQSFHSYMYWLVLS